LIPHPHATVMAEAPIATAATLVLMRCHMSIFDTPKDSLSVDSRHPSIVLGVIHGSGVHGLTAAEWLSDVTVKTSHMTYMWIRLPYFIVIAADGDKC
jgi:hypothetical protein